ncbi:MAG: dihydrodipicolinate reductase [Fibrobacterales bacterium]
MALNVMVNGIPGNMGIEVGQVVLERGLTLVPYSITGDRVEDTQCEVRGTTVQLVKVSDRDSMIEQIKAEYPGFVTVDYTHPSAVDGNYAWYIKNKLPFVMGTTGGSREQMLKDVAAAKLYSVIAPNMAKQIAGLQAMLEYAATEFPGLFSGYELNVIESHQKTKADTSGTAKAIVDSFNKMGLTSGVDDIELVRTEKEQVEVMKVPEEYLDGHAFHTYNIDSPAGVHFEFQHNVCGRKIYAEGTIDAVQFLSGQINARAEKTLYDMIDVLKSGKMS